ncbi:Transcriptional regulator [Bibersteinia trehalosi USDA-ARS-USMARC-188]|uniref:Transcriptional regulator n=3 Tax=Bibersteinia trehalosi TaxID=47735 RepID=A0A4V7I6V0_BIBTR|nr:Transcriptional regulator [Bibersteinia trehalosi USDA-ARS-USMARC-192]AHG80730.1 Transcriptional regulator [Bibersteinia trehalosi USDA-ARS-USMARC-188]AHG82877.1 Transcriptional regulator [Bibersteinia trehalosi USDA-ARS-USMARC-189]TCT16529.1 RpiR family transcriptional regulator [Bibersteinia trehalosi]
MLSKFSKKLTMNTSTQLANFQEEIRKQYDGLSKRLKQVAQYVLDNSNSVVFDTVSTIAEKANVPPSTLIRFANAFGFSGFNEIKQLFRQDMMQSTSRYTERVQLFRQIEPDIDEQNNTLDNILRIFIQGNTQALQQLANQVTEEKLELTSKLLHESNRIFIVGLKRSFSIACYLNYALHHLDYDVFLIDGTGGMFEEQLSRIREGDVVIAISFSPYANETINVIQATARSGVKHIAITDSQLSPLLSFSDVSFIIKEAQVSGFRSQCATMTLAQTIAVSLALKKA